jgi:hypothetical protein
MFDKLMIQSLLIYAILIGLIGYALTKQCPTIGKKIALWLLLIVLSFPGYFFWSLLFSAIIGGIAESSTTP